MAQQCLVCATDINLLGRNIYTINKNTGALLVTSKEIYLEVNLGKIKSMLISR
jgi:hypothetical protein